MPTTAALRVLNVSEIPATNTRLLVSWPKHIIWHGVYFR